MCIKSYVEKNIAKTHIIEEMQNKYKYRNLACVSRQPGISMYTFKFTDPIYCVLFIWKT